MIRKLDKYKKAILLRKKGRSIRQIAKILSISLSTASIWSKEVQLTSEQIERLKRGQVRINNLRKLAKLKHKDKLYRTKYLFEDSKKQISKLTQENLFLTGLALYWAEGFKNEKEGRLGFCNSDPEMIKFIITWLQKTLNIDKSELVLRAEFNESHKDRTEVIQSYWSKVTGVPLAQFNKPFYQSSIWKRKYSNRDTYYGVLRIRVRKSSELLIKIKGWISGLSKAI